MQIIKGLSYIPALDWLTIFVLVLIMLGVIFWQCRRAGLYEASIPPRWLAALRLIGFGIFSLVLISLVLMIVKDYQQTLVDSRPTPSDVEIPADLSFEVEEITFPSQNGITIAGWFVPPKNGATIILLHGYSSNRTAMVWHAEVLIEAGFGVLMYDERASGESGGEYRSFGWEDAVDVGAALDYLDSRIAFDADKIGIAGCSMGGQIALQGAAYHPRIAAVWADGPSGILAKDSPPPQNWAQGLAHISAFILDRIFAWYLDIEAPAAMIDIIGDIAPRPIMLIAGGVPFSYFGSEVPRMSFFASHAGENTQVWVIDEAYHCDGPQRLPDEYAKRLVEFFDDAFGFETAH